MIAIVVSVVIVAIRSGRVWVKFGGGLSGRRRLFRPLLLLQWQYLPPQATARQ